MDLLVSIVKEFNMDEKNDEYISDLMECIDELKSDINIDVNKFEIVHKGECCNNLLFKSGHSYVLLTKLCDDPEFFCSIKVPDQNENHNCICVGETPVVFGENIDYELYPSTDTTLYYDPHMFFENDKIDKLKEQLILNPKIKFNNQSDFDILNDETITLEMGCLYKDNMKVYIGRTDDKIIYIVAEDGNIISGFIDKVMSYQLGDGSTDFYIHENGDLIINNSGDVSSMIIIKSVGG
jgi:hypothetical protein